MPTNSVQLYVQGLLDGLAIPGGSQKLDAYVSPPVNEELDNPKAYVLASRMRGRRQTMPRVNTYANLSGYKHLDWTVDIFLTYETNPNESGLDQEFPLVIDSVMNKLWTTTMPVFITDPTTSLQSQILSIGEEFELEYPPERLPSTLRMLYFTARLGVTVYEAVQL